MMPTLSWLHFGDLHATADDDWQGLQCFEALIEQANWYLAHGIDFAVLPGDDANNGTVEQYQRIRKAIDQLRLPLHIIPGDHDFEPGSLDNFHRVLGAEVSPKTVEVRGHRCLFLQLSVGGQAWVPMAPVTGEITMWSAPSTALGSGHHILIVEVLTSAGECTPDQITLSMEAAATRLDAIPGTDAHAVEAWPEHGLLGTQFGPNKYGHGW